MREIKFRVGYKGKIWDVWRIEWHNGSIVAANLRRDDYRYNEYWRASGNEELALYQYTGLKDKNGKEIYEGDVIEHVVFDRPYSSKRKAYTSRKTVEFFIDETKTVGGDPVNCIGIRGKTVKAFEDGCCDWSEFFRCQVIGNIYENPELLEQSAQISAQ